MYETQDVRALRGQFDCDKASDRFHPPGVPKGWACAILSKASSLRSPCRYVQLVHVEYDAPCRKYWAPPCMLMSQTVTTLSSSAGWFASGAGCILAKRGNEGGFLATPAFTSSAPDATLSSRLVYLTRHGEQWTGTEHSTCLPLRPNAILDAFTHELW